MPDYSRGAATASGDDATIRPETTVGTVTTAGPSSAGLDAASVSQWATAQSGVEDPENPKPSGSSKKPVRELRLNFMLPCGNGESYSNDDVVLRGRNYEKFKMRDIVASKNPDSLEAFINEQYNDISELLVTFHLGKSEDNSEVRKQMQFCLKALMPLAAQCSFTIASEYATKSRTEKYDEHGYRISLNDIIVDKFKKLAGHMPELKVKC